MLCKSLNIKAEKTQKCRTKGIAPERHIVEVHWDDAWVDTDSMTLKKAKKQKPVRTITVGQLVRENEYGLVIASDTYPDDPKQSGIVNFIPWGMVTRYYEYQDS